MIHVEYFCPRCTENILMIHLELLRSIWIQIGTIVFFLALFISHVCMYVLPTTVWRTLTSTAQLLTRQLLTCTMRRSGLGWYSLMSWRATWEKETITLWIECSTMKCEKDERKGILIIYYLSLSVTLSLSLFVTLYLSLSLSSSSSLTLSLPPSLSLSLSVTLSLSLSLRHPLFCHTYFCISFFLSFFIFLPRSQHHIQFHLTPWRDYLIEATFKDFESMCYRDGIHRSKIPIWLYIYLITSAYSVNRN